MFKEDELFLVPFCFGEPIVCLQPLENKSLDASFTKRFTKEQKERK